MKKRLVSIIISTVLILSSMPFTASAGGYNDVPSSHWAYESINKASSYGFMNGIGDGKFGMGQTLKRAEFASLLVRMFGWETVDASNPTFTDNSDKTKWYYNAVETAYANGALGSGETSFRPEENITREEIAVMLVRALGYDSLADSVKNTGVPFSDVSSNLGYITIAYDFGIINGKSGTEFDPKGTALREEAASMMVRAYDKYKSKLDWLHGFYAFSSWGQKDIAKNMDAISFGWSRMEYSDTDGVVLNTTSGNNNEWNVPSGYKEAVDFFEQNNVDTNLDIYMSAGETYKKADGSTGNACREILTNAENRTKAVDAIVEELTVNYRATGYNFYDGVTIDFENLKGSDMRDGFVQFLTELKSALNKMNKKLYVAVQPKLKNSSEYFDGYNFKSIGNLADKVIVMAHDYAPNVITSSVMESGFTTTPVTPFDEVYYALKTISKEIDNKNKIVLALSISSAGWKKENGVITNSYALKPSSTEINEILNESGTSKNYSEKYRNPYLVQGNPSNDTTIWYENEKSIDDKIMLAKMFGITGVSVWRIGIIPTTDSNNMNILSAIENN